MTCYHDLESGRIILECDRNEWLALPSEARDELKRAYKFSRRDGEWRSRATVNVSWPRDLAKRHGFEYRGEEGERLTLDEQHARKVERSQERAEYLEGKAERLADDARAAFKRADEIVEHIPMGQPILVGHHSEGRHRRTIERCHKAGFKGLELSRKADHTTDKASAASANARRMQARLKNRRYLTTKVKDAESRIRIAEAHIKACETGTDVRYGGRGVAHGDIQWFHNYDENRPCTQAEWLAKREANAKVYAARRDAAEVDRAYYQKHLDALGEGYTKETLANATQILYGSTWYPVKRLNKVSVTVTHWLGHEDLTWKVPYASIKDHSEEPI